jgi:hypothetical protein
LFAGERGEEGEKKEVKIQICRERERDREAMEQNANTYTLYDCAHKLFSSFVLCVEFQYLAVSCGTLSKSLCCSSR